MSAINTATQGFIPISAATGKEIKLAMQRLWLVGRVLPVGARLMVRHTFRSDEKKPLEVIYSFGLPRDAALRRFQISGEGFSAHSELKPVKQATEAYEKGITEGHLAAMVRQYSDGVVNLSLGNIRPGEEVRVDLEVLAGVEAHDDGLRFRFPFTLAPSYHSRARLAEVRPGAGEIELPEDEFGDVILPQFASDASALHEVGFDITVVMPGPLAEVSSPSHPVRASNHSPGRTRLSLATAKDVPNRDLVIDVRTAESKTEVLAGVDSQGKGRFAALIPSAAFGEATDEPRRVVFVLDRSGSMGGPPMAQARKALEACLGALSEHDQFGIVAFDDRAEVFKDGLVPADLKNREKAAEFLGKVDARGGTELASAIQAAARLFGEGSGDIMLLTDGQVFGVDPIIETARSTGLRVHCLGIGSAGQDFFLSRLARDTGGINRSVTPRERVDLTAVDLFAAIGRPVASGISARIEGFEDGAIAPAPPEHAYSGTPILLYGEASGKGEGRLVVEWTADGRTQSMALPITVRPDGEGETIRLLQGARLITDLEGQVGAAAGAGRRTERRGLKMLENLSQTYGLASRAMSLVAVVERKGDRPGELPTTRVVPVGMPQDVDFGAYFGLTGAHPHFHVVSRAMKLDVLSDSGAVVHEDIALDAPSMIRIKSKLGAGRLARSVDKIFSKSREREGHEELEAEVSELVSLAALIQPDGSMPGKTEEERTLATILAVLRFLAEGHTLSSGTFRMHVQRLVKFLEGGKVQNDVVGGIIELARAGKALEGDWSKRPPEPALWDELKAALKI